MINPASIRLLGSKMRTPLRISRFAAALESNDFRPHFQRWKK
jgi:hypothetical protein